MDYSHSAAIIAIGGGPSGEDWHLDPSQHAERMADQAQPLRNILDHSRLQVIIDQYDKANDKAKLAQDDYKNHSKRQIVAAATAAIIGGCVLFFGEYQDGWQAMLRIGLLCMQGVLLAVVVSSKYRLQHSRVYRAWQQQRSIAESARVELFEAVCSATQSTDQDNATAAQWLLSLQLEYFVRYQLMVQLFYYDTRGAQHQEASRVYLNRGAIITFFVALVASTASVLGADVSDTIGGLAIIGLIGPILLSMQSSLSLLDQDERNAERYKLTHANLSELLKSLDDIRSAAQQGRRAEVMKFIDSVNNLISVEHKQWRSDLKAANQDNANQS